MSAPPELYDSLAPEDGGDSYPKQDSESTRYRRRSRSRSPPRRRSDQARSRSPAPRRERSRSPRRDSRSRSPRRDRSRSKDRMDMDQDSKPDPSGPRSARQASPSFDPAKRAAAREVAATEAAKKSKKDCRVYVGNLSFAVKWNDLKDFMRDAGTVVFSEIMMLPNGMSKGCGVVEFAEPEEAQKAIRELSDKTLLGRPLFIREDREDDARYGSAAVSGRAGYMGPGAFAGAGGPGFQGGFQGQGFQGGYQGRGGFQGGYQGGRGGYQGGGGFQGAAPAPPGQGRHLTVSGLPFNVGWQDLKDLFRAAGSIIRADVQTLPDGSPKGTGSIVYETSADAQNAIAMYNGFEFQGNILEVREDRAAPGAGGGGRGGFGGGYQGRGGFQPRGGFGGGYGGHQGFAGGRPFTQDMYAGFSGEGAGGPGGFGGHGGGFGGRGGFGGGGRGGFPGGFNAAYMGSHPGVAIAPSTQIFVKNLPWSTSNEDLIELFQTTGKVEEAEVLFDNGRSKGAGVVQFASIEEAETAIAKFQTYNYGGRPLALEFNGRFKQFGERAAVKDE